MALGFLFPVWDDDQPDQSEARSCTYSLPEAAGPALDDEVVTNATPQQGVINFGGARGWQFMDVVVDTSRPVEVSLLRRLALDAPRRFLREGASLATVSTPRPKFSSPKLISARRIAFTVCVDGTRLPPGQYTGVVSLQGPAGFQPVDVGMTVNAKSASLFGWTLGGALIVSFALLVLKGAADRRDRDVREKVRDPKITASSEDIRGRDSEVLTDPGWWLTTIVALGLGAAAGYAVYAGNTAWGDEPLGAVISVAGAVFAPAGVRTALGGR